MLFSVKKTPNMRPGELWGRWLETAARRPRAALLVDAGRGCTYRAAEITAAAEAVFQAGNFDRAGGCVAWVLPNGLDWLALFLAVQKAGWAAMPLDAGLTETQGRELARRLGATHLWTGQALSPLGTRARRWPGIAVVKTTSGSSGQAAAVPCRARHLLADYENIRAGMGLRLHDRNLGLIPWGHSYGLGSVVMPLLVDGLPIITAAAYTISQIPEWCERYHPTVFPSVPAVFQLLAENSGSRPLGQLRLAISAGAPLSPAIAHAFRRRSGLRLHNFYGASETGGICYDRTGRAVFTDSCVGSPLPGVRVTFRVGRVLVQSAAVAAKNGRHLLPDGGAWNEKGELLLRGRIGRWANLAGRKVAPVEIESQLRSLPGVTEVWCGVGVRAGRDFLAVAVESGKGESELKRALAERLPAWKQPRAWLVLAQFPRTARGKTDSRALSSRLGL